MPSNNKLNKNKKVPALRIKLTEPRPGSNLRGAKLAGESKPMPRNNKPSSSRRLNDTAWKSTRNERQTTEDRLNRVIEDCKKLDENPETSGYDQGWLFKRLQRLIRCNGKIYFYVEWTNNKVQLLSSAEVQKWHPQEVIKFYEKITKWEDDFEPIPKQIKLEIEEPRPILL